MSSQVIFSAIMHSPCFDLDLEDVMDIYTPDKSKINEVDHLYVFDYELNIQNMDDLFINCSSMNLN